MILIEGQKIYCKGCGKIIENIYDSCILLNIEANEKSPLYCLNEAIFHRDCYNNYPLRNMYEKRVAELEKLSSLNNFDYISKEELSLEKIGHPDNLIRVPFLTEDYNSPLYEYNCISLNKKNLDKWRNYKIFLKLIDNLNKSDEWRGKALSFLMSQLNSPVKPDILRQFFITDHLGTPIEAYNQEGELIWEREQDLYGNSCQGFAKENFRCPFKYQGQYYDSEVELCYNRFRYYHPETGRYISEDPIKLLGGFNVFAYVSDTNAWVDLLGLTRGKRVKDLPKNLQRRPKWRKETKDYLYENSEKTEDGKYISAKTGNPIEPGNEIIGHQNQSWREYQEATENQNKTRKEVIDDYNDLSNLGFEDKRESSSDGGKYRGYEH